MAGIMLKIKIPPSPPSSLSLPRRPTLPLPSLGLPRLDKLLHKLVQIRILPRQQRDIIRRHRCAARVCAKVLEVDGNILCGAVSEEGKTSAMKRQE